MDFYMKNKHKLLITFIRAIILYWYFIYRQPVCSQRYVLTMWATSFYILENFSADVKDMDFPSQILQVYF